MHYQYVRFNVYDPESPPRELEEWIECDHYLNEAELKILLRAELSHQVSLIKVARISSEQFQQKMRVH